MNGRGAVLLTENVRDRGFSLLGWEHTVHHGGEGTVMEVAGIMMAACEGDFYILADQGEERLGLEVGLVTITNTCSLATHFYQ